MFSLSMLVSFYKHLVFFPPLFSTYSKLASFAPFLNMKWPQYPIMKLSKL